jgi:hypothetical protein
LLNIAKLAILSVETVNRAPQNIWGAPQKEVSMTRTSLILYLSIPLGLALPARAVSYTFQTVIDPADPNFTQLLGVNNSGVIAGYFGDGAAAFNNGFTLVLPNSYTPENFPGTATLTEQQTQVVGINGSGE